MANAERDQKSNFLTRHHLAVCRFKPRQTKPRILQGAQIKMSTLNTMSTFEQNSGFFQDAQLPIMSTLMSTLAGPALHPGADEA